VAVGAGTVAWSAKAVQNCLLPNFSLSWTAQRRSRWNSDRRSTLRHTDFCCVDCQRELVEQFPWFGQTCRGRKRPGVPGCVRKFEGYTAVARSAFSVASKLVRRGCRQSQSKPCERRAPSACLGSCKLWFASRLFRQQREFEMEPQPEPTPPQLGEFPPCRLRHKDCPQNRK